MYILYEMHRSSSGEAPPEPRLKWLRVPLVPVVLAELDCGNVASAQDRFVCCTTQDLRTFNRTASSAAVRISMFAALSAEPVGFVAIDGLIEW